MKRTIFGLATILVVFVTLFAVLVVHPVRTVRAQYPCSDATLMGNYGFRGFAWHNAAPPYDPRSAVGSLTFFGNGNLSGRNIYTVHAGTVHDSDVSFSGATYSVSATCTFNATGITLETGEPKTFHGTVVNGGSEVLADVENEDQTVTGTVDIKKVQGSD